MNDVTIGVNQQVHDRIDRLVEVYFEEYKHLVRAGWPVGPETDLLSLPGVRASEVQRSGRTVDVLTHEARVVLSGGSVTVSAYGTDPEMATAAMKRIKDQIPRGENPDIDVVPITFWTYSPHGPRSIRRDLDSDEWGTIEENYERETREQVAAMMDPSFRPGLGGQLLLWHGEPGTGKTTALRSLAREWRSWADVHYVVDPDMFFGSHADYMIQVLMGDGDDEAAPTAEGEDEAPPPRWRVLILEDCGEMLAPDARRDVGQALSRFLNACDGLIGRGLRVLVLVTTNEPLRKLHDAVSRPGRCAVRIEFNDFSAIEAARWLDEHGYEGEGLDGQRFALADLYAKVDGFTEPVEQREAIGFTR